jgi:hypothetical protein
VDDLSRLSHGLTGGSSMMATNTVTVTAPGSLPGSPSEAIADGIARQPGGVDYPLLAGDRPNVVSGDQPPRANPYDSPAGGGWNVAGDDAGQSAGGWVTP